VNWKLCFLDRYNDPKNRGAAGTKGQGGSGGGRVVIIYQ
jgi:hypothetical protein